MEDALEQEENEEVLCFLLLAELLLDKVGCTDPVTDCLDEDLMEVTNNTDERN